MSIQDFLKMVRYVLTNTDLDDEQDPRLKLVEWAQSLKVVPGYNAERNPKSQRLEAPRFITP
jgi:hypothetical protein